MRSSHAIVLAVALSLGAVATSAAAASQDGTCVDGDTAANLARGCIEEDRSGDSSDPGCSDEGQGYSGENSAWMDVYIGNQLVGAAVQAGHTCQHSTWQDYERDYVLTVVYVCGEDDCRKVHIEWFEAGDSDSKECDVHVSVYSPEADAFVEAGQLTPGGEDGCPVGPPTPGWGSLIPDRSELDRPR